MFLHDCIMGIDKIYDDGLSIWSGSTLASIQIMKQNYSLNICPNPAE